ncbi:MAG TPA: HepT-like ribonuclease domain-containing protein [Thermoanaerobaculia bacterium]|nr:HepT-like ribonuclease domain-containing protein [Thermoanaerobaculia bacterium]
MRDAAQRAIGHIAGLTPEGVSDDPYRQDGVVRCLILMGEAAKNVSDELRTELSDLDWSGMIGLRNILVHRYQEIDYLQLWTIVNRELEAVIARLDNYLAAHP